VDENPPPNRNCVGARGAAPPTSVGGPHLPLLWGDRTSHFSGGAGAATGKIPVFAELGKSYQISEKVELRFSVFENCHERSALFIGGGAVQAAPFRYPFE